MNEHNDILKALQQQMKKQEPSESDVFHVPEGYFTGFKNKIFSRLADETEAATPGDFAEGGINHPFRVPEGYFECLEQKILEKTASPQPVQRLFSLRWRQIAAAIVTGLVISGSIYYLGRSDFRQMAVQSSSNGAPVIHNISINELTDFVGEGAAGNINGADKKNAVDINQLFQQVSSQDLEGFLNETAITSTELF